MISGQRKTMKLTNKDYKTILNFYKVDLSALSSKEIKSKAEHYLAMKLCKCIKKIKGPGASGTGASGTGASASGTGTSDEKRAIAICYNSVLKKKKLKVFKFSCKKKVTLFPKKGTRKIFVEKLSK
jgi:hypothetical protein